MTTDKQIEANKENAQLSTGTKTEEGKAIVSKNAIKHGLLSETLVITCKNYGESRADFNNLLTALINEFNPSSPLETLMIEKVAIGFWKYKRLITLETMTLEDCFNDFHFDDTFKNIKTGLDFEKLSRYVTTTEKYLLKSIQILRDIKDENESKE